MSQYYASSSSLREQNMIKANDLNEFGRLLATGDTRLLRFWFGVAALFAGIFFLVGGRAVEEYKLTLIVLPHFVWSFLLTLNGLYLVYGAITKRFNRISLFMEGFLGSITWTTLAVTSMISHGSVGGITVAAFINIYLLLRYPSVKGILQ